MSKTVRVTLDLDAEDLNILLGALEGQFHSNGERGVGLLAEAVSESAETWTVDADDGFDFNVVKIAPVYLELLKAWKKTGATYDGIQYASDVFEFVTLLRASRAALRSAGWKPDLQPALRR